MKALVFSGARIAGIKDLVVPRPGRGEVLIRSRRVGICHSDFELLADRYIIPFSYPVVPGHEWAGEVAEVGEGVTDFEPGDRVVGECVVGPGGKDHFGFSISGAAAEYFVARAEWLHKVPETMSYTTAALVEPFSVAYNATRAATVDPSDRVAVLGGGPIGLLTAMASLGRGARVVMVEPREDRRAKALEIGVHAAVDPAEVEKSPEVLAMTGDGTFDVVLETAGHPAAMANALRLARVGGRVVYVGIDVARSAEVPLGLIQAKALKIEGIIGSVGIWPETIRFLASGVIDPTVLVTGVYPLERAEEALAAASGSSGNIKIHFEVGE